MLVPDNPLDAWDAREGADRVFTESLLALHDDPAVAVAALAVDLTAGPSGCVAVDVLVAHEHPPPS